MKWFVYVPPVFMHFKFVKIDYVVLDHIQNIYNRFQNSNEILSIVVCTFAFFELVLGIYTIKPKLFWEFIVFEKLYISSIIILLSCIANNESVSDTGNIFWIARNSQTLNIINTEQKESIFYRIFFMEAQFYLNYIKALF